MTKETKAATSNATESVNATEVASVEPTNMNGMKQKTTSEKGNVTYLTRDELRQLGKDLGINPTAVKAHVDGEEVRIVVAHTEYGMRHDKKMDKMLDMANKDKLLTPRYHFCKPEIFRKEGYDLFDNNGNLIEQGVDNVLVICDTPETSERIYIDDFL